MSDDVFYVLFDANGKQLAQGTMDQCKTEGRKQYGQLWMATVNRASGAIIFWQHRWYVKKKQHWTNLGKGPWWGERAEETIRSSCSSPTGTSETST